MDRSSFFIKDKAMFGSYPSEEGVRELEEAGVTYFIDLTYPNEKGVKKYTTKHSYLNYPIMDMRCPTDWKGFSKLIITISNIIKNLTNNEKIYIHCKGGHGRSGVVVASLLCYLYKMKPSDAITNTTKFHNKRKIMREKWRKMGSPQTRSQKHFVAKFFEPLYIYDNVTNYFSSQFSNEAPLEVSIPDVGVFPTAKLALEWIKERMDEDCIKKLKIKNTNNEVGWEELKIRIMYLILQYKFSQHKKIKQYLINTGLRPIIFQNNDIFWGKIDNKGQNIFGKLLYKLRTYYYENLPT